MPANDPPPAATHADVVAEVTVHDPPPLPDRLVDQVDQDHPDPAEWLLPADASLSVRGLFEVWRASFVRTFAIGPLPVVTRLQYQLRASGRAVNLTGGWLDQAAAVATAVAADDVVAAAQVDVDLATVVENLHRVAAVAAATHRGVTFRLRRRNARQCGVVPGQHAEPA